MLEKGRWQSWNPATSTPSTSAKPPLPCNHMRPRNTLTRTTLLVRHQQDRNEEGQKRRRAPPRCRNPSEDLTEHHEHFRAQAGIRHHNPPSTAHATDPEAEEVKRKPRNPQKQAGRVRTPSISVYYFQEPQVQLCGRSKRHGGPSAWAQLETPVSPPGRAQQR